MCYSAALFSLFFFVFPSKIQSAEPVNSTLPIANQKEFAKRYNDARSTYARGEMTGFASVPNMMEANWSIPAERFAENATAKFCSSGKLNNTPSAIYYLIYGQDKNSTIDNWSSSFYRDLGKYQSVESILPIFRAEYTEVGCSISSCRQSSVILCAHGPNLNKTQQTGSACSKCPSGSKCTLDGLCSLRENATNTITRVSKEMQASYVRWLSKVRTDITSGLAGFLYDGDNFRNGVQLKKATNMMEVRWSDEAVQIAENAMAQFCATNSTTFDLGEYQLSALSYNPKYYGYYSVSGMAKAYFTTSNVAWPMVLTEKYRQSDRYSPLFSWKRVEILAAWGETTEVGCSMEYCRGLLVEMCAHGKITCGGKTDCPVYEEGKTCTNCPSGSNCTIDGLCSFRPDVTGEPIPIPEEDQIEIVNRVNSLRSQIAKGNKTYAYNEQRIKENITFPPAKNMMRVEWSDYCVYMSVMRLEEYCKYGAMDGGEFFMESYPTAAYAKEVDMYDENLNMSVPLDYFTPSSVAWPINLTEKYRLSSEFSTKTSWRRFDIFMAWGEVSEIGCSMVLCGSQKVMMCAVGWIMCEGTCFMYKPGATCSKCPKGSKCDNETGLCEWIPTEPPPTRSNIFGAGREPLEEIIDDEKEDTKNDNCFRFGFFALLILMLLNR